MPVMKRLLVLLTAAVLAAGLTGCVKDDDSGNGRSTDKRSVCYRI
ncbi:hypothetical protein [Anaeromassilibacillus sp. SJQ-5]